MPAQWKACLECLPQDKSTFLRKVMQVLPPALQQELCSRVPPWEQVFVAYACVTNPRFWKKPEEFASAFIAARVFGSQLSTAASGAPASGPGGCKKLALHVTHACCGIGTSVHCFNRAMQHLMPLFASKGIEVWLAKQLAYDRDPEALEVAKQWGAQLTFGAEFCECEAETWAEQAEAHAQAIQAGGGHAALLVGNPCDNLTKSKPANHKQGSGCHTAPSNAVFAVHAAATVLQNVLGQRFAWLSEQVKCAHEEDELLLNSLLGPARPCNLSHNRYSRAKRDRLIRSNPSLPNAVVEAASSVSEPQPDLGDGWKWRGNSRRTEVSYPAMAMRGWMGKIAEQYSIALLCKEDPAQSLKDYELETYESMFMTKEGVSQLANRKLLLWWMGMEKSGLLEVLDSRYPCHGWIWPMVGAPAPANLDSTVQCGVARYCSNCEICLELIGQAWEVHAMTDTVTAWLKRAVLHWCGEQDASEGLFQMDPNLVHRCCAECPHALGASA